MHLSVLHRLLLLELDVSISISIKWSEGLPFRFIDELIDGDGHTGDFTTVTKVLLQVLHGRAKVNILDKNGSLVRVVNGGRDCTCGTSCFILI